MYFCLVQISLNAGSNMNKFLLAFSIQLLITIKFINAEFILNENCKIAYESAIQLRFQKSKVLLLAESKENPGNLTPVFINNYIDFLKCSIGEEVADYLKYKSLKYYRIAKIEKGNKSSPYYRYFLGEIYLHSAFLEFKNNEFFTGALDVNRAYRLLDENHKLFPGFIPNYKNLGLLHALVGTIPDEYYWITKLFSFKGTVEQGITEQNYALAGCLKFKEYNYLIGDCLFLMAYTNVYLSGKKENLEKLLAAYNSKPFENIILKSALLHYTKSLLMLKTGRNEEVIKFLAKRKFENDSYPVYYLDLMLGICKLNRLDSDADRFIKIYLENYKGKNFVKSAWQKLSWYYYVNDNPNGYLSSMQNVISQGNDLVDDDKQALAEAKGKTLPNMNLLKARLLFDGGYYLEALNVLVNVQVNETYIYRADKLEFTYRLARIFHEMQNFEKAIYYYNITLEDGEKLPYYFAANSSLNLGLIYENQNDRLRAIKYYNKTLSLKPTQFKNGIHQKAKAGKSRLSA